MAYMTEREREGKPTGPGDLKCSMLREAARSLYKASCVALIFVFLSFLLSVLRDFFKIRGSSGAEMKLLKRKSPVIAASLEQYRLEGC